MAKVTSIPKDGEETGGRAIVAIVGSSLISGLAYIFPRFVWTPFPTCLREFPGTPRSGTPFWEASYTIPIPAHTTPINRWKFMGSLWEPYGKGVPFFGAPGNSLDLWQAAKMKAKLQVA